MSITRREFLASGGALVVSFALPADAAAASWPTKVDPALVDSWLRIGADGSVIASVGKIEAGMGIGTAFAQIVAEELDVPIERVTIVMGDTAASVDQRGTGSSNGIIDGGAALRHAAALAAERLKAPAASLVVRDGVVHLENDAAKGVSYAELVGGRELGVRVAEKPKTKDPKDYRVVGKPIARFDIPPKVRGDYRYVGDLRVDGMLHARVVRPPEAGAKILRVDLDRRLPGLVKVVRRGDFLGVVCEREEQAIEAALALPVEWSRPSALYWNLRSSEPKVSKEDRGRGDVDKAFASAARVVEARYEYPFQSHASMGPACALADVRDGGAIVWSGGQKPYPLRHAIAELLALPLEKVRVVWHPGPGSYGMNDADDCAADAALLAQAVGRPVRLQYTRADGTGWDPKGPPVAFRVRAALDASSAVTAWDYEARGFSGRVRRNGTDEAGDSLAGQLMGVKSKSVDWPQFSAESYDFANVRKVSRTIAWERSLGTPLRTAHLRDPDGMSTCFASESFVDEVAFATRTDPVEFRLRHLKDARDIAAVKAAAEKAGWRARVGPAPRDGSRHAVGRGIAYAPRSGAVVAIVAEVEVDRQTGRYRVRRFTCAHDCGFVINPSNLRGTMTDWITYPIVDMTEVPDAVDIVILNNRPEAPSRGAGEPGTRPVAAAIANALFDAVGVRLRRVPLTPESLLAALSA